MLKIVGYPWINPPFSGKTQGKKGNHRKNLGGGYEGSRGIGLGGGQNRVAFLKTSKLVLLELIYYYVNEINL